MQRKNEGDFMDYDFYPSQQVNYHFSSRWENKIIKAKIFRVNRDNPYLYLIGYKGIKEWVRSDRLSACHDSTQSGTQIMCKLYPGRDVYYHLKDSDTIIRVRIIRKCNNVPDTYLIAYSNKRKWVHEDYLKICKSSCVESS
jgi:hypothetical protein